MDIIPHMIVMQCSRISIYPRNFGISIARRLYVRSFHVCIRARVHLFSTRSFSPAGSYFYTMRIPLERKNFPIKITTTACVYIYRGDSVVMCACTVRAIVIATAYQITGRVSRTLLPLWLYRTLQNDSPKAIFPPHYLDEFIILTKSVYIYRPALSPLFFSLPLLPRTYSYMTSAAPNYPHGAVSVVQN